MLVRQTRIHAGWRVHASLWLGMALQQFAPKPDRDGFKVCILCAAVLISCVQEATCTSHLQGKAAAECCPICC